MRGKLNQTRIGGDLSEESGRMVMVSTDITEKYGPEGI
jgi:hypothetical protein